MTEFKEKVEVYTVFHDEKSLKKTKYSPHIPLFVGCNNKDNLGYCSDDTGDNISYKNKDYAELTGLYWIWKNSDADIIGLTHYRRYFVDEKSGSLLNNENINNYLNKYDLIIPKPFIFFRNFYNWYKIWGYDIFLDNYIKPSIEKNFPEYIESYEEVLKNHILYPCSMFIGRKDLMDNYCNWLFTILFDIEEKVLSLGFVDDFHNHYCDKRILGFIGESIFNVWIHHNIHNNNLKIKTNYSLVLSGRENLAVFMSKYHILRKLFYFGSILIEGNIFFFICLVKLCLVKIKLLK
ncbi:MAG: DUF4422 domain-containing protein [Methanobrevibacter sp.]|jgi:hypothetical protein|nr:DUF4422 domain-containing protein [Candidatus Methanoflexus mossambicus]